MDTIKLIVTEPILIEGSNLTWYDVKVILNGETLPHSLFNAVQVLAGAEFSQVEFYLFTCSCGVPECGGFHDPVKQSKKSGIVAWLFPQEDYYKTSKKVYEFSQEQFESEFKDLKNQMLRLEEKSIHHTTLMSDESRYVGSEDWIVYAELLGPQLDWWHNRYMSEFNFDNLVAAEFSQEIQKQFYWVYGGAKSNLDYDFGSLIKKILNQYPQKAIEPEYLQKVKEAGRALVELLHGDNSAFKVMVNKSYVQHDLTPYSLIDGQFGEDVTEEDWHIAQESFDIEKLTLTSQ